MPANTNIFLLGLAVGTGLLVFGLLLGYWLGRKTLPADSIDRQQVLAFLKNLSNWTSEFSVDVNKYQSQLTSIDEKFRNAPAPPPQEMLAVLSQIMQANRLLQERLESAEQKLDLQTEQISGYLTEARTDGLTGLFNRRAFDKATDALFSDWKRNGQAFALGLIDIDHFKQINDTFGHPAGDAVLKLIATELRSRLPDAACIARYGGEEFAMLTTSSLTEAAATLDNLRDSVGQIEVNYEGQMIAVTLSAGAAQIQLDEKIGNLVRRADEALYTAKSGGRNRVYQHDGTICHLVTRIAPAAQNAPDRSGPPVSPAELQAREAQKARVHDRLQRIVVEESQRITQR